MTVARAATAWLTKFFRPVREQRGLHQFIEEFLDSRIAMVGLVVLTACVLAAIAAPWIAPQNPYDLSRLDILDGMLPPGSESADGMIFLLGSDDQGRDLVSGILYGMRISIGVGIASTLIALFVGSIIGMFAGYAGGRTDALIMRIVDIQLSFPSILIALILLAILGPGIEKIILALVTVQWAYYARTIRGATLVERDKDYIQAARCLALSDRRILLRHLLPNCLPPLIVIATIQVAHAITLEATLSFLGVGLPVTSPSLGLLISNGYSYLLSGKVWVSFFPGLALVIVIVSINLVGDQLRDILNPRLRT